MGSANLVLFENVCFPVARSQKKNCPRLSENDKSLFKVIETNLSRIY